MYFRQLYIFMLEFLSKYQSAFRKSYSIEYCLRSGNLKLIKENHSVHYWQICRQHLTVSFHKLLPVKFYAYGFGIAALRLIHSYLTNRKQTTKVLLSYSLLDGILFGVPQVYHKDPIPGPLLFNIFSCGLFFIMSETDFARYSADNTSHRPANTINEVIQSPEHYSNNGSLITK